MSKRAAFLLGVALGYLVLGHVMIEAGALIRKVKGQ